MAASRWLAPWTSLTRAAASILARSSRTLRSKSANIGASNTTPSSRPSLSRPSAPAAGSGCPSKNPASASAAEFSTQACSEVW